MHVIIEYLNSANEMDKISFICEAFTYDKKFGVLTFRDKINRTYTDNIKNITNIFVEEKYQVFKENQENGN